MRLSWWWLTFAALGVLAAVVVLGHPLLPGVDLPPHVAQARYLTGFGDLPAGDYVLQLFTPYLTGYLLIALFDLLLPLTLAVNVTVFLGVLAYPLALSWLARETGTDRWWAFAGFLLAFSNMFFWGFLNYWLALPIGAAFLAALLRNLREPTVRHGVVMGLLCVLLFFTHAIAAAFFLVVGAVLVLGRVRTSDAALRQLLPVLPTLLLAAWWWSVRLVVVTEPPVTPVVWSHPVDAIGSRSARFFSGLFGFSPLMDEAPPLPEMGLVLLLVAVLFLAVRPTFTLSRSRWAALLVLGALYLFGPDTLSGNEIEGRLPVVIAIAFFLVLERPFEPRRQRLGQALAVGSAVLALVTVQWWLTGFDEETRDFRAIAARIPPQVTTGLIVRDGSSNMFEGRMFDHYEGWLAADGHASNDTWWSTVPVQVNRPWRDANQKANPFQYLLVRGREADQIEIVRLKPRFERVDQEGPWALYKRNPPRAN